MLREQEIDPSLIQVEITESLAMETSTKILEYISAMNELGVRVAIDDFGTGYSSFSYLRQYNIDAIKIDRSFVSGLPHDDDNVAIVRAIISLGRNLGLRVVAEGIETQEQLSMLREGGCDVGQGFLLGRPQPARDLHLVLETRRISLSDRVPIA